MTTIFNYDIKVYEKDDKIKKIIRYLSSKKAKRFAKALKYHNIKFVVSQFNQYENLTNKGDEKIII